MEDDDLEQLNIEKLLLLIYKTLKEMEENLEENTEAIEELTESLVPKVSNLSLTLGNPIV